MLDQNRRPSVTRFGALDLADLLQRICVRPPYFALNNLSSQSETFWATAVAERAPTPEQGPMQACEISRHAAICGLCAVALTFEDDDQRYYLAQDAVYEGFENDAPYGSEVSFEARVTERNKRQARAEITVTAGGRNLARLKVSYSILGEASFRRLFRSKYSPSFSGLTFDRMPDPPVGVSTRADHSAVLTLDCVPEEACAGHFEHYPAMPVAVLMGQLGLVAGHLYGSPYRVGAATMTASDFCWAGESARFEVTPLGASGGFHGLAYASETVVSEVSMTLIPARILS